MDNGDWKERIRAVNLAYLTVAREIGLNQNSRDYAIVALGIDDSTLNMLVNLDPHEMESIADIGATLFRVKPKPLHSAMELYHKGAKTRAIRMLAAGLLTGDEREG